MPFFTPKQQKTLQRAGVGALTGTLATTATGSWTGIFLGEEFAQDYADRHDCGHIWRFMQHMQAISSVPDFGPCKEVTEEANKISYETFRNYSFAGLGIGVMFSLLVLFVLFLVFRANNRDEKRDQDNGGVIPSNGTTYGTV